MSAARLDRPGPSANATRLEATYILPIRRRQTEDIGELTHYLRRLSTMLDVVVVDGSPPAVFAHHAGQWSALAHHLPPDDIPAALNGKVRGVLTGLRMAVQERLVIADDDVRYESEALARTVGMLDDADVIRPQNYFDPQPWHARWDTARILLNRMTGGDWPGTLAVRRSILAATGGYDGGVLFENLELVRTVLAAGGTEAVPPDLFVRRRPPDAEHFWSQRVRQAYDELARPVRLVAWLSVLPLVLTLVLTGRWRAMALLLASTVGLAECGRWRGGGRAVFPLSASLLAPAWIAERAVCSWLALGARVAYGGVPYHGTIIARPATPMGELRRRHGGCRGQAGADACEVTQAGTPASLPIVRVREARG
jgi:hypothetical protein